MRNTVSDADRIAALSEGQRACLRMVAQHRSSKEIARALNISPHTVDKRLEQALRKLGVATRWEAARLFATYEGFVYEPLPVAEVSATPASSTQSSNWERMEAGSAFLLPQTPRDDLVAVTWLALPFPRTRGEKNDLTIFQRLLWAAGICVAGITASALLFVALEALGRLI